MKTVKAAAASLSGSAPLPHSARFIKELPSPIRAVTLLAELASKPRAFSPAPPGPPLALYGAGNMGRLARDFLAAVGENLVMVIDRDPQRFADDPTWADSRPIHPNDAAKIGKDGVRVAVCVVTAPYVPIEKSLLQLGFTDVVPFYDVAESFRAGHPLSNGWFAGPLTALDQVKIAEVLGLWDDDASRAHHLRFLAWRMLREEWDFEAAPVPDCSRFFIPEIVGVLNDDEFFLDAGAHHGGLMETFATQTKGVFRRIVAVEPDPFNRAHFERNLKSSLPDDARVAIYDCALAEAEGTALFHAGLDYASQLSPTGTMSVTTRPLDALGLSPTFVKLHLEGGELAALKGARQTLLSNRPIIAATVYHNADGLWKTPLWLMETLPDYRFLFRAHSWCGTGAVVYGIPTERTQN